MTITHPSDLSDLSTEPIAIFSPDTAGPDARGQYRYTLWRCNLNPCATDYLQFICLNPSTADEHQDDPTVLRCWKRAQRMGYGSFVMTNLFALRATDPKVMLAHPAPVGPDNTHHILRLAKDAAMIILAWGKQTPAVHAHSLELCESLRTFGLYHKVHVLAQCSDGTPRHPLYLRNDITPYKP